MGAGSYSLAAGRKRELGATMQKEMGYGAGVNWCVSLLRSPSWAPVAENGLGDRPRAQRSSGVFFNTQSLPRNCLLKKNGPTVRDIRGGGAMLTLQADM